MLSLPRRLYDDVVDHARRGQPAEVCGVLGGQFGSDHSVVESVHEARNAADRPEIRYAIDPAEQFEIMERIEAAGEEVVGFYHSHPSGPRGPSATDASRATWPDRSYVIVALDDQPAVNAWRWDDSIERFRTEPLTTLGGGTDGVK